MHPWQKSIHILRHLFIFREIESNFFQPFPVSADYVIAKEFAVSLHSSLVHKSRMRKRFPSKNIDGTRANAMLARAHH
jgi:hypothetical protein